jgi:hypothetical protein
MYNSRPRYTRIDNYPQAIKVPRNYSGNAFGEDFIRESEEHIHDIGVHIEEEIEDAAFQEEKNEEQREEQNAETNSDELENKNESEECSAAPKKRSPLGNIGFGLDLGKLFGNFGIEELLIIGLIFLIAQSEGNEDMIFLLILLFFIN